MRYTIDDSVLLSCFEENKDLSDFEKLRKINEITSFEIPKSISDLENKQIRFSEVISKDDMESKVYQVLGIM